MAEGTLLSCNTHGPRSCLRSSSGEAGVCVCTGHTEDSVLWGVSTLCRRPCALHCRRHSGARTTHQLSQFFSSHLHGNDLRQQLRDNCRAAHPSDRKGCPHVPREATGPGGFRKPIKPDFKTPLCHSQSLCIFLSKLTLPSVTSKKINPSINKVNSNAFTSIFSFCF